MKLQSTNTVVIKPHSIVYGPTKSGKTRLIPTLTAPVIMNTDFSLGSIRDSNIPFADCPQWKDIDEFLKWVYAGTESKQFKEVVVDDFSEMCNIRLQSLLPLHKDARQAYGQMADDMLAFLRKIKTITSHTIVVLCKEERIQDANKNLIYSPMVPGNAVQCLLGYLCDQLYHMETWTDPASNIVHPVLRTKGNLSCIAGDRSGRLSEIEFANLGAINAKVMS